MSQSGDQASAYLLEGLDCNLLPGLVVGAAPYGAVRTLPEGAHVGVPLAGRGTGPSGRRRKGQAANRVYMPSPYFLTSNAYAIKASVAKHKPQWTEAVDCGSGVSWGQARPTARAITRESRAFFYRHGNLRHAAMQHSSPARDASSVARNSAEMPQNRVSRVRPVPCEARYTVTHLHLPGMSLFPSSRAAVLSVAFARACSDRVFLFHGTLKQCMKVSFDYTYVTPHIARRRLGTIVSQPCDVIALALPGAASVDAIAL